MAFSREDTASKVIAIIAKQLNTSSDVISEQSTFKDLGADSLDIVEIIMGFEEAFGIQIHDEDAEKIKTVAQAIDLIHGARTV